MSRRRPGSGATISLFPFLAVLLCTMGSLLVLLVIFSRRAQESQTAADHAAEEARAEELELARDELRWRLDQLRGVRDRTAEDLTRERMRLAGVEEDARRLADELDVLERRALALEEAAPAADAEALADAERKLAAARAALEEAREDGATKPPAYAVVPYEGANGTHRRPLYVECCVDGVFLQPEGIRLGPGDFEGPPGPGNPLASAMRAAREHLARHPSEAADPATQPYPLLLVRPSGVMAYYAAREALVSWGSEFGYQFVDEDWQLRYPPADPTLADVEQRAIEESRRRLEWLAQARPARPARPTQQYRAATTRGGVVAEGGPSVLGDRSRFDWTEEQAGTARRGKAAADGARDAAGAAEGPGGGDVVLGGGGGGGAGAGSHAGPGSDGDRYAGPSRFYSGYPPASAAAGGVGAPGGPGAFGGSGGPYPSGADSGSGAPGAGAATGPKPADVAAAAGPGGTASAPGGDAASQSGAGSSGASGAAGGSGASGGSGAPGASRPSGGSGATGSSAGLAGLGAAGGGGGTSGGPALPGMMQAGATASASCGAAGSLAGARGSNWASLATAERPVPLTRPIRVECAADEFRVFDDGGTRVETRIPIGTRTADSVDPLVQAVHGRVGRWGLAGDRMYWRPVLVLSETTDGRSRREDLERLLADSGLDTRRDSAADEVRPLPPVMRATAATLLR